MLNVRISIIRAQRHYILFVVFYIRNLGEPTRAICNVTLVKLVKKKIKVKIVGLTTKRFV